MDISSIVRLFKHNIKFEQIFVSLIQIPKIDCLNYRKHKYLKKKYKNIYRNTFNNVFINMKNNLTKVDYKLLRFSS